MRAIAFREYGPADVLQWEELPTPEPAEHELLVEVHATSVNPVDTKVSRMKGIERALPVVLGYDVSGVVVRCGADVQDFQPGDEVFGCPNLFGPGANAEYVRLDARAAARKPVSVDHATAATLPLVALTAWESLHDRARLRPGETMLIHAGAGGVGHIAVQLAHLHGASVITTAGRPESLSFCRDVLQAEHVVDYTTDDFVARVRDLSGGKGVRAALDTVGGAVFGRTCECMAPNGQLVTILPPVPEGSPALLLYRSITVHYEFMGVRVSQQQEPERQGAILAGIARLVDLGFLKPHVSTRFPLDRLADAHRAVETGRTLGKVAIVVR